MRDVLKTRFVEPIRQDWQERTPEDVLNVKELTDDDSGRDQLCKINVVFADGNTSRTYLLCYQKTYSLKEEPGGVEPPAS